MIVWEAASAVMVPNGGDGDGGGSDGGGCEGVGVRRGRRRRGRGLGGGGVIVWMILSLVYHESLERREKWAP